MNVYLAAIVVFAVALAGMAIGVILSNRRIRGTCGGLAGMHDERGRTLCDACSNPSPECAGDPQRQRASVVENDDENADDDPAVRQSGPDAHQPTARS